MTGTTTTRPVGLDTDASAGSPGPSILLPRRRPGYLGPMHITQLLVVEGTLAAVLATLTQAVPVIAAAAASAAVLLLVTLGRVKGRWWIERRLMLRRYRRRRQHEATAGHGGDPRVAAMRRLAPGLTVENVPLAGGSQVAVARDEAGWFAVAAVPGRSSMRDGQGDLPLDTLAAALAEVEQPGAVLQVVIQAVPAPSPQAPESAPAGQSYRQLLERSGQAFVPSDRSVWIAVRLDARSLAEALAGHTANVETAPAVVAALLRRVAKALRPVGIEPRLLDADGLLTALVDSCDLTEPLAGLEQPAPETWSAWRSARFSQRCYWIRRWPPVERASGLLNSLFAVPAAMTCVALIMAPDERGQMVDLRALVRIGTAPADLDRTCQRLVRGARKAKAELFPLDGEQAPAAYAAAPTGGGAR
jgi:type VII secretion protein EccE